MLIGTIGSLAVSRSVSTLLFQIRPADPTTFAAVALLLTAVAMLAIYLPVRRAMNVNPISALREE
jgi:ABC-type lipoprotein release transport system permease subunit